MIFKRDLAEADIYMAIYTSLLNVRVVWGLVIDAGMNRETVVSMYFQLEMTCNFTNQQSARYFRYVYTYLELREQVPSWQ